VLLCACGCLHGPSPRHPPSWLCWHRSLDGASAGVSPPLSPNKILSQHAPQYNRVGCTPLASGVHPTVKRCDGSTAGVFSNNPERLGRRREERVLTCATARSEADGEAHIRPECDDASRGGCGNVAVVAQEGRGVVDHPTREPPVSCR